MAAKKRKRKKRQDSLVLNLLIIVILVLAVFEGRLVVTLFTHRTAVSTSTVSQDPPGEEETDSLADASDSQESEPEALDSSGSSSTVTALAGLPVTSGTPQGNSPAEDAPAAQTEDTVSDPDSPAIVPKTDPPVDDSYFSDAVFIGDSRMEGFRNASGITQVQFFTSVGMNLSSMANDPIISTADGMITVPAAVSGGNYSKIYVMLGTNDLGEYDWEDFRTRFVSAMNRLLELEPGAVLYVCSVVYVEEAKVASQNYGSYVNNANVDTINAILLELCEEQGYYYLDFNEILSNGYGALIDGASEDGIHIYGKYCEQMLDYLKSHYIPVSSHEDGESKEEKDEARTEEESESESETEDGRSA